MSVLTVEVKPADYENFEQLLIAVRNQKEYRQFIGGFWIFLIFLFRKQIADQYNQKIAYRIIAKSSSLIVGIFEISFGGELGVLAITDIDKFQLPATLALVRVCIRLMNNEPKKYIMRTFNKRLYNLALKGGFHHSEKDDKYIVAVPLGPFTFSYIVNSNTSFWTKLLPVYPLLYIKRDMPSSSSITD